MIKDKRVVAENVALKPSMIDLWAAEVDCTDYEIRQYERLLSSAEIKRSGRFRFVRDRNRFVARRGILRVILSAYMNCEPLEVEIRSGFNGKPYVGGQEEKSDLQFSTSHSAGLAVFAFGRFAAIGADIERISSFPEIWEVASLNFTQAEMKEMNRCPVSNRGELFFKLWTRKEAVLKANGEGLALPLCCVDVSGRADNIATWSVRIKGDMPKHEYQLTDVMVAPGFAAAVAAVSNGHDFSVTYRRYPKINDYRDPHRKLSFSGLNR